MGGSDLQNFENRVFDNRWKHLNKNLACPYEYFNCLDDHRKPVDNLKNEDLFSKLKNKCPSDEKIERAKVFSIRN